MSAFAIPFCARTTDVNGSGCTVTEADFRTSVLSAGTSRAAAGCSATGATLHIGSTFADYDFVLPNCLESMVTPGSVHSAFKHIPVV